MLNAGTPLVIVFYCIAVLLAISPLLCAMSLARMEKKFDRALEEQRLQVALLRKIAFANEQTPR
jgi:hypothetical protein